MDLLEPIFPGGVAPFDCVAFVGGYEPRRCGIATFTHDLCEAVSNAMPEAECIAAAVNDRADGYPYPPRVRFEIPQNDLATYRQAANYLNTHRAELLCVQHEFGIFGGPAGSHLLSMLRKVRMPIVTTLHTILREPSPEQRHVMEELLRLSTRLVVMASKGAEILREIYGVPDEIVDIIPHGIPDTDFVDSDSFKDRFSAQGRTVLLTYGLLGPGKGVEYVIEALPEIVGRHPDVIYLVLGATHPHLVAQEGEVYRLSLEQLARDRGVNDHVLFYDHFVSTEELTEFINAADLYLTPYLNEAQITSGTLAHVFGAGNAVVSTPYWHAQELLAEDRGKLVPFRDPQAIADAVCAYLDDPDLLAQTREQAYQHGRGSIWSAVAQRYLESFEKARGAYQRAQRSSTLSDARYSYDLPPLRLDHVIRMSDGTGIFQHATYNVPNFNEGYCTDDNARAYILCNLLTEQGHLSHLATSYLAFLAAALDRETGRFRNFMSHGRQWLEDVGSEDSHGRALWALGVGAGRSDNVGHRLLSAQLLEHGLPAVESFTSPRAWAFSLLGIEEYLRSSPEDAQANTIGKLLTRRLVSLWKNYATADWPWFEPAATYDNARLCQALILSGKTWGDEEALEIGLKSLRWLSTMQKSEDGHFRPIGSNGFYKRNGIRAEFDQQPVEAQAMVAACLDAFCMTDEPFWLDEAKCAFEWFLGRNDQGLPLYDPYTGGCGDGLHHDRVNANQGAESSLAFQLALAAMNQAQISPNPSYA